jgi:hypothetical protein
MKNDQDNRAPVGRSISDFGELNSNETKILECARNGSVCALGPSRPDNRDESKSIRPEILRFLILGGDKHNSVHESGVYIKGASIQGTLNLGGCDVIRRVFMDSCSLSGGLQFVDAKLRTFLMQDCWVDKIEGNRANIEGSFALRHGSYVESYIWLWNATISGFLSFGNATIKGGLIPVFGLHEAIAMETAVVHGDALLSCRCLSRVSFEGTRFGKDLVLSGGQFAASQNNDDLERETELAIDLRRVKVEGTLWLSKHKKRLGAAQITGGINLANARVGVLADCPESMPTHSTSTPNDRIILDGFEYDRIHSVTATDLSFRRDWLFRQPKEHLIESFKPQPFEQLIRALRIGGHDEEATFFGIAKQRQYRLAWAGRSSTRRFINFWTHLVFGLAMGYGYRVHRLVLVVLSLWAFFSAIYYQGGKNGLFSPSNPAIYTKQEIVNACKSNWVSCADLPANYEPFNPFLYSADIIFPVISFNQSRNWSPISSATPLRISIIVETILGWMASIFLIAAISGIIKRD